MICLVIVQCYEFLCFSGGFSVAQMIFKFFFLNKSLKIEYFILLAPKLSFCLYNFVQNGLNYSSKHTLHDIIDDQVYIAAIFIFHNVAYT